jgi:SAM-dependent methyltransferase
MTRAEADFVQGALAPHGKLLDAPCGNGRIACELASRGFEVTGLDATRALLDVARASSSAVAWQEGDMRDLAWTDAFDAITCMWGSFGYFSDDDNLRHLAACARALRTGGKLILDVPALDSLLGRYSTFGGGRVGDILVVEERRFDVETSRVETEWTFVKGDRAEHRRSSIRIYSLRELRAACEHAGFARIEAFGSLDRKPFAAGSRLYLLATKS